MTRLNPEIIKAARGAKSSTELADILGVNGIKVSAADADRYFAQLNGSELSDDDLSAVAGGGGCNTGKVDNMCQLPGNTVEVVNGKRCPKCGGTKGYLRPSKTLMGKVNGVQFKYLEVYCRKDDQIILDSFFIEEVRFL